MSLPFSDESFERDGGVRLLIFRATSRRGARCCGYYASGHAGLPGNHPLQAPVLRAVVDWFSLRSFLSSAERSAALDGLNGICMPPRRRSRTPPRLARCWRPGSRTCAFRWTGNSGAACGNRSKVARPDEQMVNAGSRLY